MNLVFQINGGLGKCIAATAVCSALKKKYPNDELIVISGYPEVFINNPNVKKTLSYNNLQYFYQDYIESKECKFFLHDPYLTTDYVKETKHLIQIWCELFDIPYHNEQPEFFLTQRELELYQRQVQVDKPIMMLQTNGGGDTNKKYSWARDIPTSVVLKVIEEFANKYSIFHIRREDQLSFQGTIQLTGQLRQILAISLLSQKRLVMDSFLQHALAALKLPSVACWIVNSPKVFGYELNTNILANAYTTQPELRNSYLSKFNIGGDELEFPYNNETEIFNIDEIIQAINSDNLNSEKNEIANDNRNIQSTTK
jgi:ADP-heptose:LPS heptosyltransferase